MQCWILENQGQWNLHAANPAELTLSLTAAMSVSKHKTQSNVIHCSLAIPPETAHNAALGNTLLKAGKGGMVMPRMITMQQVICTGKHDMDFNPKPYDMNIKAHECTQ